MLAVNAPPVSACSQRPAAYTAGKVRTRGPLPPVPASDVHIRVCPAKNPIVSRPELPDGAATHSTARILFAPLNEPPIEPAVVNAPVGVAIKVLARRVASGP